MGWSGNEKNFGLSMVAGDFGVAQEITLNDLTISASDTLKFTIKKKSGGETLFTQTFTNVQHNTIAVQMSAAESEVLTPGEYVYYVEWYNGDSFLDTLIDGAPFKVKVK